MMSLDCKFILFFFDFFDVIKYHFYFMIIQFFQKIVCEFEFFIIFLNLKNDLKIFVLLKNK